MGHQDCLHANGKLQRGQRIYSPNRALELVMQDDGNLVLYRRKDLHPLWASNTNGKNGQEVVMQGDGNLVMYCQGHPIWASNTHGHHGVHLKLQNDGNLVLYGGHGNAIWASNTHGQCPEAEQDHLHPGEKLLPGRSIHSRNGKLELILQLDGNLVLYAMKHGQNQPVWASNTNGRHVREAIMQTDGNLVVYDAHGHPIWASNTNGRNGAELKVQDDGNLCIYQHGHPHWASNTHGCC